MVYGQKKGREKIKGDREGKGLEKKNKGRERERSVDREKVISIEWENYYKKRREKEGLIQCKQVSALVFANDFKILLFLPWKKNKRFKRFILACNNITSNNQI